MRTLLPPAVVAALAAAVLAALPPGDRHESAVPRGQAGRAAHRGLLKRLERSLDPAAIRALAPAQRRQLLRYAEACFDGDLPPIPCWNPGTPLEVVHCFHAVEELARGQNPDGDPPVGGDDPGNRWSWTATDGQGEAIQGNPVALTWGIAPDGSPINASPGTDESSDPSDLIARLAVIYGSEGANTTDPPELQPWFPIFEAVFDNISAQTGITYVYEPNDDGVAFNTENRGVLGVRPDVRIGGHDIDGDPGIIAYNFFPDFADMILDTNDSWIANTSNDSRRLRNLVEHEHGHGLGLPHVCPLDSTKIMEPSINTGFVGIQFDDLYSLQTHYGDYYEKQGNARNNDSYAKATALSFAPGTMWSHQWLSIDGKDDIDYFSFTAVPNATITVRAIPSPGSYEEGREASSGASCPLSSYPVFEAANLSDLSVELLGPGHNVLATADPAPAGQSEEILSFVTPGDGTHYVRVSGDGSDAAQLYRLEVEVDIPAVALDLTANVLLAESFAGQNGHPDPGETVRYELTLTNIGSVDATNVQALLVGPTGFVIFEFGQSFGDLDSGASATRPFTFGLEEECNGSITATLAVTADGGYVRTIPVTYSLGSSTIIIEEEVLDPGLPPGWTSTTSGGAAAWVRSSEEGRSLPWSLYAATSASAGESILLTPTVTLGPADNFLSFYNLTMLPFATDGGILEIAINGGAWQEIITAGGTFTAGGYNAIIQPGTGNPLAGRLAWTGNATSFAPTTVLLPPAATGQDVQLRWRLGHDNAGGGFGWFVDDITLTSVVCDTSGPVLTLAPVDTTASEFNPLDVAEISITTGLPVVRDIPITLINTGTAGIGTDVISPGLLTLPAGQSQVGVNLQAISDSYVEGDETLALTMAEGSGSALITVSDTPYGQWAASRIGLGAALNGPSADFDFDDAPNIVEYAWKTNPANRNSTPPLPAESSGGGFLQIPAPDPLPPDLILSGQGSTDLLNWGPSGVQAVPGGFRIPITGPCGYLRLDYQLTPTAP